MCRRHPGIAGFIGAIYDKKGRGDSSERSTAPGRSGAIFAGMVGADRWADRWSPVLPRMLADRHSRIHRRDRRHERAGYLRAQHSDLGVAVCASLVGRLAGLCAGWWQRRMCSLIGFRYVTSNEKQIPVSGHRDPDQPQCREVHGVVGIEDPAQAWQSQV
mgnify:FL=1